MRSHRDLNSDLDFILDEEQSCMRRKTRLKGHFQTARFDPLEPRLTLSLPPMPIEPDVPLITDTLRHTFLDSPIVLTAPSSKDGQMRVVVSIVGEFPAFLKNTGSLPLDPPPENVLVYKDGTSVSIDFEAPALIDVLGEFNGKPDVREFDADVLYGAQIRVFAHRTDPDANIDESQEYVFRVHRYVSAVEPGSNEIDLEFVRGGIARSRIIKPVGAAVDMRFDSGSNSADFSAYASDRGWRAEFYPKDKPESGQIGRTATMDVYGGWPTDVKIGTLRVNGTLIAERTWWLDEEALASQLRFAFQNASSFAEDYFTGMAQSIVSLVDGFAGNHWFKHARRVHNRTDAVIVVDFPYYLGPVGSSDGTTALQNDGISEGIMALHFASKNNEINDIARNVALSELLVELFEANPEVQSAIDVDAMSKAIPAAFQDAVAWQGAGIEIAKTIAHEIGHAHGFVGHIVPQTTAHFPIFDVAAFDVMQQGGFPKPDSRFEFVQSHWFMTFLLGLNWDEYYADQVFERITDSESGGFFAHYVMAGIGGEELEPLRYAAATNPANRFDVNRDGNVTPLDVLIAINALNDPFAIPPALTATLPRGPLTDVNHDGVSSPLDVLWIINWLNRSAINVVSVPSVAIEPPPIPVQPQANALMTTECKTANPHFALSKITTKSSPPPAHVYSQPLLDNGSGVQHHNRPKAVSALQNEVLTGWSIDS